MGDKVLKKPGGVAGELRSLLDHEPSEEVVHQFFADRILGIGVSKPRDSKLSIAGALSKFPITPDRIPDFCSAYLLIEPSQAHSTLTFIELKRPSSPLFTSRRLLSKDLNDAWVECIETSRLMADNFRDFLRRFVKALNEERLRAFDDAYDRFQNDDNSLEAGLHFTRYDMFLPRISSVIVIGRRASLDSEEILRTRELSASTGGTIRVITYDTVLDWISEAEEQGFSGAWCFFLQGYY